MIRQNFKLKVTKWMNTCTWAMDVHVHATTYRNKCTAVYSHI